MKRDLTRFLSRLAFADDIVPVLHDINTILDMIVECEGSGNNWYTGKRDTKPKIIIQSQLLTVYGRNE